MSKCHLVANVLTDGDDTAHYGHHDTGAVALLDCGSAALAPCDIDCTSHVEAEVGTVVHVVKVCDGKPLTEETIGGIPITINGGIPGLPSLILTPN